MIQASMREACTLRLYQHNWYYHGITIALHINANRYEASQSFRPAISNPNGPLSQKVCHYLHQGRTLNGLKKTKFNLNQCPILTAMVTDVKKRHWGPSASKIASSRLSKQGQVISI